MQSYPANLFSFNVSLVPARVHALHRKLQPRKCVSRVTFTLEEVCTIGREPAAR